MLTSKTGIEHTPTQSLSAVWGEFAPKRLSKCSFKIANAASIILDWGEAEKKGVTRTLNFANKQKNKRSRFARSQCYHTTFVLGKIWLVIKALYLQSADRPLHMGLVLPENF